MRTIFIAIAIIALVQLSVAAPTVGGDSPQVFTKYQKWVQAKQANDLAKLKADNAKIA